MADLEDFPDDGLRYELVDGTLLVSPSPRPIHQEALLELAVLLRAAATPSMKVYIAPLDWQPNDTTSLEPDVLVLRRDHVGERRITAPLTLAVEVLSPSTRRYDAVLKTSVYAEHGVESYWLVDPVEPSILAYELKDGAYVEVGRATGGQSLTLEKPFEVTVTPKSLVSG
ncbi:Uma2 family endonuclease [Jiangella ureilytica]|uniref:Uma2 family endonuclease n=1 Tax=Jiangella ureilytica TaxID=2530374 RepID=UPI00193CC22E|nr:Uma2 family endonuclease [Jiangella ureilytica]